MNLLSLFKIINNNVVYIIIVLLFSISFTSAEIDQICAGSGSQCADIGKPCDQGALYSGRICKYGSYCGEISNKCEPFRTLNQACNETGVDSQCVYPLSCVNQTCTEVGYLQLNDACTSDSQCVSPLVCSTTNNVCSVVDGSNCTSNIQCAYNEYCFIHPVTKVSSCMPRIQDYGFCSQNFTSVKVINATTNSTTIILGYFECLQSSVCTLFNRSNKTFYQCAPRYSVQSLGVCKVENGVDSSCDTQNGFTCFRNTCIKGSGELTSPELMCNSTYPQVCGSGYEVCSCAESGVGQCIQSELRTELEFSLCGQAKKKLNQCAAENKCSLSTNPSQSSCLMTHCAGYFCDQYSLCDINGPGTIYACAGKYPQQMASCLTLGYTGYDPANYNHTLVDSQSHDEESTASLLLPPLLALMVVLSTTLVIYF